MTPDGDASRNARDLLTRGTVSNLSVEARSRISDLVPTHKIVDGHVGLLSGPPLSCRLLSMKRLVFGRGYQCSPRTQPRSYASKKEEKVQRKSMPITLLADVDVDPLSLLVEPGRGCRRAGWQSCHRSAPRGLVVAGQLRGAGDADRAIQQCHRPAFCFHGDHTNSRGHEAADDD